MNPDDGTTQNDDFDDEAGHTSMADWPVEEVIGEEMIDGKKYFWVVWEPSLISEVDAASSRRLLQEWESRKAKKRARAAMQLKKAMRERVRDGHYKAPRRR